MCTEFSVGIHMHSKEFFSFTESQHTLISFKNQNKVSLKIMYNYFFSIHLSKF